MSETVPVLEGLVIGDDPDAWRAAGFDVASCHVEAGGVALSLAGSRGERGILGWTLRPPAPASCDGLIAAAPKRLVGSGRAAAPARSRGPEGGTERAGAAAHPNGVVALDHVVVTTDDLERTTSALAGLGLVPRRTVVGLRGDGDDELAYRFFLLRTCVLELVGPTTPRGDGPARFAGLAFATTAIEQLGPIAGPVRDAVQPGRRIATLRGEALGISVPVALLSPRRRA